MNGAPPIESLVRIGAGHQAEVFAWDEGRVLRLARQPEQHEEGDRGMAALDSAGRGGGPAPEVFERVHVHGRPGVVMEHLDGEDLLFELGRKPWHLPDIARALGRLHAQLNAVEAPPQLPSAHEWMRWRLTSTLVPDDVRAGALTQLDALPEGDRL